MRLFTESWWKGRDYLIKVEIMELFLRKVVKYKKTQKMGLLSHFKESVGI